MREFLERDAGSLLSGIALAFFLAAVVLVLL